MSEVIFQTELPMLIKWKNTECRPDADAPIVWISRNGKIGTFKTVYGKDWGWLVKKYSIILWIWQESIIPEAIIETKDKYD